MHRFALCRSDEIEGGDDGKLLKTRFYFLRSGSCKNELDKSRSINGHYECKDADDVACVGERAVAGLGLHRRHDRAGCRRLVARFSAQYCCKKSLETSDRGLEQITWLGMYFFMHVSMH